MPVRLFVGNLPYDTTEAELRDHLSSAGPLTSVYLPINKENGKPRGFAFVEFGDSSHAEAAIRMFNNQGFKGRTLSISEARARESRPPGDFPRGPRPPMGHRPPGSGSFEPRSSTGGPGAGGSRPFTPRFDRPAPAEPFSPPGRKGRPEKPRTKSKKAAGEFKGERGPKRPIREKPGGRLYEGFEGDAGLEEDLLEMEDDFSRSADEDWNDEDNES